MTNTVDVMRAKTLFDVIKEPCGMDTILSTVDLCRDFKIGDGSVVNALKNINIEIEKGKLTILRGRSGSGKTTLINILGALDKPTKGKVMLADGILQGFLKEPEMIYDGIKWRSCSNLWHSCRE